MGVQERMDVAHDLLTCWRFLKTHHDIAMQSARGCGIKIRLESLEVTQVGADDKKSSRLDGSGDSQMDCQPTSCGKPTKHDAFRVNHILGVQELIELRYI